jgi:uncharacterized zinc-type alcohol dehydrogenase-like protein
VSRVGTYNSVGRDGRPTYGGLSAGIVVDRKYVVPIPDGLDLATAAPLLCAGVTVYSPLKLWGAGPGKRVTVVGLGGLGHLAVKFASALGAEVTAVSRGTAKRADALRFGASNYVPSDGDVALADLRSTQDLILSTVSAPSVNGYLAMLRRDGALVSVGLSSADLSIQPTMLMRNRRSIAGSNVGSIAETTDMLALCADRGIVPEIELVTPQDVAAAYARVASGAADVRYRLVIDMSTL